MGTRSLICVFYKGRFVIAQYSRWDGYPEGQGARLFKFLSNLANIERLKDGLQHIYTPDEEELNQMNENIEKLQKMIRAQNSDQNDEDRAAGLINEAKPRLYLSLSGEAGAKILDIVAQATAEKRVPIELDLDFANNGMMCEFAYVVDLDHDELEVFEGSQYKAEATSKRFNDIGDEYDKVPWLVKSYTFTELPKTEAEFVNELNAIIRKRDEEEEEQDGNSEVENEDNDEDHGHQDVAEGDVEVPGEKTGEDKNDSHTREEVLIESTQHLSMLNT